MSGFRSGIAALAVLGCTLPAAADVFPRLSAPAASVISRKAGEEARFIDVGNWQAVDINQDLLVGDTLRTNAYGHLAVLFTDNTQIRLGRNSTMVVKKIGGTEDTILGLETGTIWGRAERGDEGVTIETPAAAAAIRGTDWTLTVEGDKTSLIVLEGVVELYNELGSVSVARGEAAVARIGQAPTKTVIVDPDDKAQMLYYLSLRSSFNWMPASPLSSPDMRQERARLSAKPESARGADDWLTLAEIALSYDGHETALDALEQAAAFRLSRAQKARYDLVDAMLTAAEGRYDAAAKLFAGAAPKLDPKRRATALYAGYFARALADPDRAEAPPKVQGGGPYAALAEAWTAGFLKDIPAAIAVLKAAEERYPDDPSLPAYRAQLALLVDDREQVEAAIARALALDPDDPTALEARANYRAGIQGDLDGAYDDLTRAAGIAPGSSTIQNALGLVQSSRGGEREAEAALKRAIELDPRDPLGHANLAIFYLDQDRVKEAKAEIDKALELDPAFDVALVARGRYHMQTGELDKARQDLLAGTTANPAYAQALLLLSAAYYESGDREPAAQSMENADRLDPNDPATSSYKTVVAIDDYDAEAAIDAAQEMLARSRARGGHYAPVSANKEAGSVLNDVFRLQGLDAWGRYYGQAVFDPFNATGFVDQALSGSADPFLNDIYVGGVAVDPTTNSAGFSSFLQGLMLDPAMLSGRSRSANLARRPFVEGSAGGGYVRNGDGTGWIAEAELQGYVANPVPWSFYGKVQGERADDHRENVPPGFPVPNLEFDLSYENVSGTGYLTARPTPYDRVVAYVDIRNDDSGFNNFLYVPLQPIVLPTVPPIGIDAVTYDRTLADRTGTAALGWSHTFGYRNVANVAVMASGFRRSSDERAIIFSDLGAGVVPIGVRDLDIATRQDSYLAAASHSVGFGDLTLRYGGEGGLIDVNRMQDDTILTFFSLDRTITTIDASLRYGRAYADAIYEVTPDIKVEGALFGTWLEGDGFRADSLDPHLGIAWAPVDGHWLRAGFARETDAAQTTTLAPVGVVGLQANQVPLQIGGQAESFMARWDAQWSDRFFTSLDYQHQNLTGLSVTIPGSLETIDIGAGRLDRVSATGNLRLGGGFGAFATVVWSDSENEDPFSNAFGQPLPYVPDLAGRFGITWVNPANIKVTAAATYVGERNGNALGDRIGGYWTADAFLTWEPLDKRFQLELAAYNIFDEKFLVAAESPGWGRTFVGSFKVRF
jgi:tetratricopeptide (TPR) repeat protein